MKGFVNYLAKSREGTIGTHIRTSTLKSNVQTFFATWWHLTSKYIPQDDRAQVADYLASDEFRELAPLITAMKDKRPAHIADVKIIIDAMLRDKQVFKTNRQRLSMMALLLLSMTSSERPGALVESHCYRGSNQSLLWRDVEFLVVPDKENPNQPTIVLKCKINSLKNGRDDDSKWKEVFLYMETPENRDVCPVFALLSLAVEDGVFLHADAVEEILMPVHPPTAVHKLVMHDDKSRIPILRAQVFENGVWMTSPTLPMKYEYYYTTLKIFCRLAGFQGAFLFTFFKTRSEHFQS